jgi:hypothetical protein
LATLFETYDALVAMGADPHHTPRREEMRRAFEARTGAFGPDDPWFEARSRAFWDDALTTQGFAREAARSLAEGLVPWGLAFGRAHRGLFERFEDRRVPVPAGSVLVRDVFSGAEVVVEIDAAIGDALRAATGLMDARLVGHDGKVGMLPGVLFHQAEATVPIRDVVSRAKDRGMEAGPALDALMRMELRLRSLSRVKVAYAYRPEML